MDAVTYVHDRPGTPRVTLTRDIETNLTAVIEVEGLDARRAVSADEIAKGILSLTPPTVTIVADPADRPASLRALTKLAIAAVLSACVSTSGITITSSNAACVALRVGTAVRRAMQAIGEDT